MATFDNVTRSLGVSCVNSTSFLGRNRNRKSKLLERFASAFTTAKSLIFFTIDNIPTQHLQHLKNSVQTQYPNQASFVFGKNTLYKRAIKTLDDPNLSQLLPLLQGNIACLSCSPSVDAISMMHFIEQNSIQVCAKAGMIANKDLYLPKAMTQLSPERTALFQAAGVHTKITNGKIEVLKEKLLTAKGSRVDETSSKLLELLKMKPLAFDMKVKIIYEYGEGIMDLNMVRVMESAVKSGVAKIMQVQNWLLSRNKSDEEEQQTVGDGDKEQDDERREGDDCDCCCGNGFDIFGDEEDEYEEKKDEKEEEEMCMGAIFDAED